MITSLFAILERGENGAAYNVTNTATACSIKEMAKMLTTKYTDTKLRIEPQENKFYLDKVRLVLDTKKLESINWKANIDISEMYERLVENFKIICKGEINQ